MSAQAENGVSRGTGATGPSRSRGPRVIALMNQKGGVGKTTTTVNLAAAIAESGKQTLVVDLDPQAHASLHLGIDGESRDRAVYDLLIDPASDAGTATAKVNDHLHVLAAETDLAGVETELASLPPAQRVGRLRDVLSRIGGQYDYVLIDCPPSLGVLTLNGLAAAGEVIIPMQAHFLALQGVSKLLETVSLVRQMVNPALRVTGVVVCMYDAGTTHSREVVDDLRTFLEQSGATGDAPWKGAVVFDPPIRRNIKLAECPSFGQNIFQYSPWCPGALDYRALAERVMASGDAPKPVVETVVRSRKPRNASAEAGA